MLNKNDVIPLYVQLQRILREQILNGEFKEMDLLPSETQLMKKYNITRTTIRKAIAELKQEGFVQQVHGKGTYVRLKEAQETVWNFQGFSDLAISQNKQPVTKLLEQTVFEEDGEHYLKLIRLRGLQSDSETTWMTIDTSTLPLRLFPHLNEHNFTNHSLYQMMRERYQVFPHFANLHIEPIMSTEDIRSTLKLEKNTPLLKSSGSVYTENNIEIEQIEIIYSPLFKFKLAQYICT